MVNLSALKLLGETLKFDTKEYKPSDFAKNALEYAKGGSQDAEKHIATNIGNPKNAIKTIFWSLDEFEEGSWHVLSKELKGKEFDVGEFRHVIRRGNVNCDFQEVVCVGNDEKVFEFPQRIEVQASPQTSMTYVRSEASNPEGHYAVYVRGDAWYNYWKTKGEQKYSLLNELSNDDAILGASAPDIVRDKIRYENIRYLLQLLLKVKPLLGLKDANTIDTSTSSQSDQKDDAYYLCEFLTEIPTSRSENEHKFDDRYTESISSLMKDKRHVSFGFILKHLIRGLQKQNGNNSKEIGLNSFFTGLSDEFLTAKEAKAEIKDSTSIPFIIHWPDEELKVDNNIYSVLVQEQPPMEDFKLSICAKKELLGEEDPETKADSKLIVISEPPPSEPKDLKEKIEEKEAENDTKSERATDKKLKDTKESEEIVDDKKQEEIMSGPFDEKAECRVVPRSLANALALIKTLKPVAQLNVVVSENTPERIRNNATRIGLLKDYILNPTNGGINQLMTRLDRVFHHGDALFSIWEFFRDQTFTPASEGVVSISPLIVDCSRGTLTVDQAQGRIQKDIAIELNRFEELFYVEPLPTTPNVPFPRTLAFQASRSIQVKYTRHPMYLPGQSAVYLRTDAIDKYFGWSEAMGLASEYPAGNELKTEAEFVGFRKAFREPIIKENLREALEYLKNDVPEIKTHFPAINTPLPADAHPRLRLFFRIVELIRSQQPLLQETLDELVPLISSSSGPSLTGLWSEIDSAFEKGRENVWSGQPRIHLEAIPTMTALSSGNFAFPQTAVFVFLGNLLIPNESGLQNIRDGSGPNFVRLRDAHEFEWCGLKAIAYAKQQWLATSRDTSHGDPSSTSSSSGSDSSSSGSGEGKKTASLSTTTTTDTKGGKKTASFTPSTTETDAKEKKTTPSTETTSMDVKGSTGGTEVKTKSGSSYAKILVILLVVLILIGGSVVGGFLLYRKRSPQQQIKNTHSIDI